MITEETMQSVDYSSHIDTHRVRGLVTKGAVGVVCAGFALMHMTTGVGGEIQDTTTEQPTGETSMSPLLHYRGPGASQQSIITVMDLVKNPPVIEIDNEALFVKRAFSPVKARTRKQEAEALGLTLHSANPVINAYGIENGTDKPFKVYLDAANTFANQYGITVREAEPTDNALVQPLSEEATKTNDTKLVVRNIIPTLAAIPEEYPREVGLDTIIIADLQGNRTGLAYPLPPGTIAIDAETYSSSDVLNHEFGHQDDYRLKAILNIPDDDTAFTSLNRNDIYSGDAWPQGAPDSDEVINNKLRELYAEHETVTQDMICSTEASLASQRAKVQVPTNYSLRNPAENRAEQIKDFTLSGSLAADTKSPVMQDKQIELLAREYQENKELGRWFAFLSTGKENRCADGKAIPAQR